MKCIALLGPTASGKTSLSIKLAQKINANILSLDSLSIYKQINIASAKPSLQEREGIKHFGIDVFDVNEHFNVAIFFNLFRQAKKESEQENRHLIIVGGTSFYLKSLMEGLSKKPTIDSSTKELVAKKMQNLEEVYMLMEEVDLAYAQNISKADSYRIEKWLEVYLSTGVVPSVFFKEHTPKPLLKDVPLFEITPDRDILRERIRLRTDMMLTGGLLDEVFMLERRFTRAPKAMSSIGIKEALQYYDGYLDKAAMREKIITNTARLAKRQRTFNKGQFRAHPEGDSNFIEKAILEQI